MSSRALLWETADISKRGKGKGEKTMISKNGSPGKGRVMISKAMSLLCSKYVAPVSLRVTAKVLMMPKQSYRIQHLSLSPFLLYHSFSPLLTPL